MKSELPVILGCPHESTFPCVFAGIPETINFGLPMVVNALQQVGTFGHGACAVTGDPVLTTGRLFTIKVVSPTVAAPPAALMSKLLTIPNIVLPLVYIYCYNKLVLF